MSPADLPGGLPDGAPVVLDRRTRLREGGAVALGGAPWGVVRLRGPAVDLVRRLRDAGGGGAVPAPGAEHAAADRLVARGLLHPAPRAADASRARLDVEVVVPAYERGDLLQTCLAALARHSPGVAVTVVDDASPSDVVARVASRHGCRVVRHPSNRGPAAGRNTGLATTTAAVVAFVDSDCAVGPGWLAPLLVHFDDDRVAAVAPRVRPLRVGDVVAGGPRLPLLARHERARSALDMGPAPQLVRPGAPLGFLPSATILLRRSAVHAVDGPDGFDERLRLGEDVDLVWRLAAAGWLVRYEPAVQVHHEARLDVREWAGRRYEYGTSAAALDTRHPGRLTPARLSAWNLAALLALASGRPAPALAVALTAAGTLGRRLRADGLGSGLAAHVVATGLLADAVAVGHALRREWWPLGWFALATAPRSRLARAGTLAMLAPVAYEWLRHRPDVDPVRYTALRLAEDAAYGSGVLASAVRHRRPGILTPRVRFPGGSGPRAARRTP